ncbi:MAG: glycosyltransferase [Pseudomonadota bacterium]
MNKRALLIAYHYPPVKGSSGVQRALRFSAYLRDYGWACDVLTVHPRAYERQSDDELGDIPRDVDVIRAQAFDTKRHLSLFGRYPQALALPDRWMTWRFDAIRRGRQQLKKRQYDVIWSTFPISTAHRIGMALAKYSGLPWVADCRDSMSEPGYPREPAVFEAVRALEQQMVHQATAVTFTTPGARRMYAERYPELPADRWRVIENGFDERAFDGLDDHHTPETGAPLTLVHAGLLYPRERDPRPFFAALSELKQEGYFLQHPVRVILRATGHDELYRESLTNLDIADIVTLEQGVPYRDALQEMLKADGLLIFQSSGCNHQIPAKAYEYLRAGRPILSLTDRAGDTAQLLQRNGQSAMADLLNKDDIKSAIQSFVPSLSAAGGRTGTDVSQYSRRGQTAHLAALFDELAGKGGAAEATQ